MAWATAPKTRGRHGERRWSGMKNMRAYVTAILMVFGLVAAWAALVPIVHVV